MSNLVQTVWNSMSSALHDSNVTKYIQVAAENLLSTVMTTIQHHCGISATLTPSINVFTYLLTFRTGHYPQLVPPRGLHVYAGVTSNQSINHFIVMRHDRTHTYTSVRSGTAPLSTFHIHSIHFPSIHFPSNIHSFNFITHTSFTHINYFP